MVGPKYISKNLTMSYFDQARRIALLETDINMFLPLVNPHVNQSLTFQFQATQFAKMAGVGDARIYPTSAPSSIDEETLAAVVAYATFDDIGGTGAPVLLSPGATISDSFTPTSFSTTSFGSLFAPSFKVPLLDGKGRTAYYIGAHPHLDWSAHLAPEVEHTKQFMVGHSLELNVPGTVAADQKSYAYYDSHANFNVSSSFSVSLWFYPSDLSIVGDYMYLLYRYIDASNYFAVTIIPTDRLRVFVKEAGTETKIRDVSTSPVGPTLNSWNLMNITYNPSTNALVLYLNGVASTTATGNALTPPYTADANMYIGGLPNQTDRRFKGYLDNFVFWTGKILSAGEVTNMWTRGTIV